jgi:hypothetical protein
MSGMGTTFIVITSLKLAAAFGTGIALSSAFSYFHNYEWKPRKKDKKEKGDTDGISKVSTSVRAKTGFVD